jgi:YD repeat-containing protein
MFPRKKVAAVCLLVAAGSVVLGQAGAASAQTLGSVSYTYKTVTVPGEARSELNGVNARGSYAGEGLNSTFTGIELFVASPSGHMTFYQLPFTDLDTTAVFYESAAGMDNAGDVVGVWTDTDGRTHGFERQADGKITEINDPSASDLANAGTAVAGISTDGTVIVGGYYDSSLALHGFLLERGRFTTYDVPAAADTELTFYDHGTYGGYYVSSTGAMFGFYVRNGQLYTVAAPGEAKPPAGSGTELTGMSADGTLFGTAFPAGAPAYGFSLADGTYSTIADPNQVGTTNLDGTAVNNANEAGVVVGGYTYTAGTSTVGGLVTGFMATPSTWS